MILFVPASSRCAAGAVIRRHADAARNVHIAFASSLQGSEVVRYQAAAHVRVALLRNRVALLACSCAKHSQKDSTKARSRAVHAIATASFGVLMSRSSALCRTAGSGVEGRRMVFGVISQRQRVIVDS